MIDSNPTAESGFSIAESFASNIKMSEIAQSYMAERGLDMTFVDQRRIGFCSPYSKHWFPLLKGRFIVTIHDAYGRIIAFAGRKIDALEDSVAESFDQMYHLDLSKADKQIERWRKGKWINEPYSKGRHLYNLFFARPFIEELNYVVLVEGYIDALVLEAKGIKNVCALCGTAFTPYQAALLARYVDNIVLMTDGDEAGLLAAEKAAKLARSYDLKPFIVNLPKEYDPDSFVRKHSASRLRQAIERTIENGTDILNIKIKSN